jgi:hypothetical protein
MPTIEPIAWTELHVGKTYNVQTSCVDTTLKPFVLKEIIVFPDIEGRSREAMLIATNGGGYAVGGNFDEPGGPMNLFFPFPSPEQAAMAAEPPDFPNAVVASVLEHIVGILELPAQQEQQQPEPQQPPQPPPRPSPGHVHAPAPAAPARPPHRAASCPGLTPTSSRAPDRVHARTLQHSPPRTVTRHPPAPTPRPTAASTLPESEVKA